MLRIARHGCLQLASGEWVYRHDPLHVPRTPIGFEVAIARRFWSAIQADVLYVEGERSPFRLGGELRAERLGSFTGARSLTEATIAGAGHMMLRHAAGETARVLNAFLE